MGAQGYLRFPTITGDAVAFTAEDDLWRVAVSGGRAERLTAGVAEATHARYSPDGHQIAFISREEGPTEVYLMLAEGGAARRLTFEGERAAVAGWRPDGGAVLYVSAAGQPSARMQVLHSIAPSGGLSETLPWGPAHSIAFGPGGAIVIGRNTAEPAFWKRYHGGTAGYLWIDPEGQGAFHRLIDLPGNMTAPCWAGGRVYFISDHEGMGDVYSCLPDGTDLRRHTRQRDYYARQLTSDGRRLVYGAGGDLYLLEPTAERGERVAVELPAALTQRARRFVPAARFLDSWAPQPQSRAVALTTRGRAFSMGPWEGPVLQHGAMDGTRYRLIRWLADGKRLLAVSDAGAPEAEPRLVVFTADGSAPDRVLDGVAIGDALEIECAPVGEQALVRTHRGEILLVDVAAGTARALDGTPHARSEVSSRAHGLAWSPDAQWVAYALATSPQQSAIKLARVASGETWQITDPVVYDTAPAFDPQGRYLYFIGARSFDPVADTLRFGYGFPRGTRPYALTLRRELRSPFEPSPEPPHNELDEKLTEAKQEQARTTPEPVGIDVEGLSARIVAFPVDEGRYERVQGTHDGVVFSSFPVEGTRDDQEQHAFVPPAKGALEAYHFETHKRERLLDGLSDFAVTPDGKTLLYRSGERLRLLKAGEKPPRAEDDQQGQRDQPGRASGWIDLDRVKVSIQPEAEWRQMFGEAWRLQRDHYWVADMAGVNWRAIFERYRPLLARVGSRGDLSDLIWELQGELGSSHAYEFGGAYREHPDYSMGHLGVTWRFDAASGHYVIAGIARGDPWEADMRSPLLAPGVNARVGDAVLAINGQRLGPARAPQELLVSQAGQVVELLLAPAEGGTRAVTVRALRDAHPARYRDWVEATRRHVHEATEGRVGYLHIPDMMYEGLAEFTRSYLLEYDRPALIVDVRWNTGGMVSQLMLELLRRPRLGYAFQRWGQPEPYFCESARGPLVAITDENAGSDGDIFSHAFKLLGLGPLVGKRTWGGVVGFDTILPLADGTITSQPEFSFWFHDVGWGVENYGTDPTIEVDYPPQAYAAGADPQLERAIVEALAALGQHATETPTPAPRPHRGWPS